MDGAFSRRAFAFAAVLAACVSLLYAADATIWDISSSRRFDPTNKSYDIAGGRVTVDFVTGKGLCPTGLGNIADGRPDVKEILIRYEAPEARDYYLHVTWNPGGSGLEQFEVLANGRSVAKTPAVEAAKAPYKDMDIVFKIPHAKGANDLILRHLSGDGLEIKRLALTTGEADVAPAPSSSGESPTAAEAAGGDSAELPTGTQMRPDLKFPTLASYEKAIREQAVMLDSEHVAFFAPERREKEANVIAPYLVRAYEELYKIVGVHTKCKMVVYHFPDGSESGWGGTSECVIWYGYSNLALETQNEWKRYRIPHVSGYIEEMAHNFVDSTKAQFGWEMIGWHLGVKATAAVAKNSVHTFLVDQDRQKQAATYWRYKSGGFTFPRDIEPNLADRIHAHLLWQCEEKYGPSFWKDFFAEVRKERVRLLNPGSDDADARRNVRYRITIDCFDRLKGLNFKKMLQENHISLAVDVKSLHPTEPGWNRKFE